MENGLLNIIDYFGTLCAFTITLYLGPLIIIYYFALQIYRKVWLKCLTFLNPNLEFLRYTTIRSLVDTFRNQGILTLLLTINGPDQPDLVRRHLQAVVNRQDKLGNLSFPHLRQCLVRRFGKYAWQNIKFNLDQNFVVAPVTYRGRPIAEINLQDYISDVVSKYLSPGASPWQVVIIPGEVQHHLLVRVHHTLLNDGLNMADLLPVAPTLDHNIENIDSFKSSLIEVVKQPQSIPQLMEHFQQDLTNFWNEFVFNYDPLEQPELFKTAPNVFKFLCMCLVTVVSILKTYKKGSIMIKNDYISKLKYLATTIGHESRRRNVTSSHLFQAILVTINPFNVIQRFISLWYSKILQALKIPYFFYLEISAIYSCLTLGYCKVPHTFVGITYNYLPLLYNASKEGFYYLKLLIRAPRTVLEQVLFEPEMLQTIPPCGRKVVAWSKPVKRELIQKISKEVETNETEILLATISVTIAQYCAEAGITTPSEIPVTIRNVNSKYIFASGLDVKPQDSVNGLIGLRLPVLTPEKDETLMENLITIKENLKSATQSQAISYLLTIMQTKNCILTNILPDSLTSILLKYLSRKYTISITEITNTNPNVTQKTAWGEDVLNAIYWRPPQANMSISLCFNEYGENITLGVMCDAQLLPYHPVLARYFSYHVEDIAASAGIE